MQAPSSSTDLFDTYSGKSTSIALVDASISTKITKFQTEFVFDKQREVLASYIDEECRLIFWNSDRDENQFTKGIFKFPFIIKKDKLLTSFNIVSPKIYGSCMTFPHLGFNAIPDEWICKDGLTKIYFVTDGEMTDGEDLKKALLDAIKRIFDKYSNIQLYILTVEARNIDLTMMENMSSAAGSDVYNVIMRNNMTKYITKFVSYTRNNLEGFVHINKNIPPPGFIPYVDKYFHAWKAGEFIEYIKTKIDAINSEEFVTDDDKTRVENELLQVVQDLAPTVSALIKDKSERVANDIIRTFINLFSEGILDMMFVQFILSDAIKDENAGSANVFASFRAKLKDLFREANKMLQTDVTKSVGINDRFISFPIDNKIVSGDFRMIDRHTMFKTVVYPYSAIEKDGILVPVVPLERKNFSQMNDQCLRQWVRQIISKLNNVNPFDDIVIHIVLANVLRIRLCDVDESIKMAYRGLGETMLRKKRTNTDVTEIAQLETGALPTPNSGKIDDFYKYMGTVNSILNLNLRPMTMWYAMCLALDNPLLASKQLPHCKSDIAIDFPNCDPSNLLLQLVGKITKVIHYDIVYNGIFEYYCVITLENTTNIGGFRFLPHKSRTSAICSPLYVLSKEGYESLLQDSQTSLCPICYARLTQDNFTEVGPQIINELKVFDSSTTNIFDKGTYDPSCPIVVSSNSSSNSNSNSSYSSSRSNSRANSSSNWRASAASSSSSSSSSIATSGGNPYGANTLKINIPNANVVVMKGTVGSGKSTYARKIKERVEAAGGQCLVVGTDKYCKNGMHILQAIDRVKEDIAKINYLDKSKQIVLIVDTCGEKCTKKMVFEYNIAKTNAINFWPNSNMKNLDGYAAWTLRNVLSRTRPSDQDRYNLNPETAGTDMCIRVHQTKTSKLYAIKKQVTPVNEGMSKDQAIKLINDKADEYQQYLDANKNMDDEITKLIAQFK